MPFYTKNQLIDTGMDIMLILISLVSLTFYYVLQWIPYNLNYKFSSIFTIHIYYSISLQFIVKSNYRINRTAF